MDPVKYRAPDIGSPIHVGRGDAAYWAFLTAPILLAHFQFETIHPFLDGNGRLGRLLIVFYLVERAALSRPLLYLSAFFERNRQAYVDSLQAVRERGELDDWVDFFVRGVAEQAQAALESTEALLGLREDFRARLRSVGARGSAIDAAENLIGNPTSRSLVLRAPWA